MHGTVDIRFCWTDETVAELRRLHGEKWTCREIAAYFGNITRNAVIGKLHRLGLTSPQKFRPREPRQNPFQRIPVPKPVYGPPPSKLAPVAAAAPVKPSTGKAISTIAGRYQCDLFHLADDSCRFPIGDPGAADFCFCGTKAIEGLPYCGGHSRLVYRGP